MHTVNNKGVFYLINRFINNYHIYVCVTFFLCFSFLLMAQNSESTFLQDQIRYERVEGAFSEKELILESEFLEAGLIWPPKELYIRSFKAEASLEVWVKNNGAFLLFKEYNVCKGSGNFGPKRKEGDRQVPEGLYYIDRFNPVSNFWLSLGINYPNESDKILSDTEKPGGDIFIHGDCVTIGCLPMTNDKIKEIYILSVLAKNAGQSKIPVHSFPFKFNLLNKYIFFKEFPQHQIFWSNLETAYTIFEEHNKVPEYWVDEYGKYQYKDY